MTAHQRARLRVATEYLCHPLWLIHADGGTDNAAPGDLGLPADLVADLSAWAADYDAIFPPDDPGSAAFARPQAEIDFYDRGLELARHGPGPRRPVPGHVHGPPRRWGDRRPRGLSPLSRRRPARMGT